MFGDLTIHINGKLTIRVLDSFLNVSCISERLRSACPILLSASGFPRSRCTGRPTAADKASLLITYTFILILNISRIINGFISFYVKSLCHAALRGR